MRRRWCLIVLVWWLGWPTLSHAQRPAAVAPPAVPAIGFDHLYHSQKIDVSGAPAINCMQCHPQQNGVLQARPDHRACFGACHGTPPTRATATARMAAEPKVCGACHSVPGYRVAFPPYVVEHDFGIALSHVAHNASACTTCHRAAAPPNRRTRRAIAAPHARCTPCHGNTAVAQRFAITDCARCHIQAFGPTARPVLAIGVLPVTGAFRHEQAAHRGTPCVTCHRATASSANDLLAPPTKASCATSNCHDGKAAFATTAMCARCHQRAPTGTFVVARPTERFNHARHETRNGSAQPCSACHRNGNNEPSAPSHDTCVSCHADDFASITPKICGACHQSTEAWRHLPADQRPLPTSEFGAQLDHRVHPAPCSSCHTLTTTTTELRPARGHSACITCHQAQAKPRITECAACHVRGLAAQRMSQRSAAPWSTRTVFNHRSHAGAAPQAPCSDCHTIAPTTGSTLDFPAPPKAACARCHDGARAFSVTSTQCRRCHNPKPR
jgi:c(7)-type cytochrome triheme protein